MGLLLALGAPRADAGGVAVLDIGVRDSVTGAPLAAWIGVGGAGQAVRGVSLGASGREHVTVAAARVEVTAECSGYRPLSTWFQPDAGATVIATLWLDPLELVDDKAGVPTDEDDTQARIDGWVRDAAGSAVAGARVSLPAAGAETRTGRDGSFTLRFSVAPGNAENLPALGRISVQVADAEVAAVEEVPLVAGSHRYLIDSGRPGAPRVRADTPKLVLAERGPLPDAFPPGPDELDAAKVASALPPEQGLTVIDPPASIRVGMSCSCSSCSTTDVVTLETYVRRGLNDEWIASWTSHSLRAGAVAYRSYGSHYVNNPINANYDICSTTCCQVNDSDTSASTSAAADAVSGFVVQRNGSVFRAEYSAENNAWDDPADGLSCTNGDLTCGDGSAGSPSTSWPCIADAPCVARGCFGHGRGECQWGTQRWALSNGRDWVWITNHYYNGNGGGSGFRTSYIASPISLDSTSPSPASVAPGGTFTVNATATNLGELAHTEIIVAASLYSLATGTISDAANDTKVTLAVGANTVARPFAVPPATPAGTYDLVTTLWFDVDADNVIDAGDLSLVTRTAAATVTVTGGASGTCGNPIVIGALPYTHSSTTSGRPAALDGYSCPPSSGSEAGPEAVYMLTLTEPGNLTVTVSDGAGVDIDPHLLSACAPAACLARNDTTFTAAVQPGTYWIVCDTWTTAGGTQYPGAYTLNVSFASTAGDTVAPAPVTDLKWSAALTRWQWSAVTQNRLGGPETMGNYQVWRSTVPTTRGTLLATTAALNYPDAPTPPPSTCWYYQVRAIDAAANRDSPLLAAIADNPAAAYAGTWTASTSVPGYYGSDYRWRATGGTGTNTATWSVTAEETGLYTIAVQYSAAADRSPAARFTTSHAGGPTLHTIDQRANGGAFRSLGTHWLQAGTTYTAILDDAEPAGAVVIADAMKWSKP